MFIYSVFDIYIFNILVVGQFSIVSTRLINKIVEVNKQLSISCPEHRYSYNVKYKWEYLDVNDDPQSLRPSPEYFVTENGTLYFSKVYKGYH